MRSTTSSSASPRPTESANGTRRQVASLGDRANATSESIVVCRDSPSESHEELLEHLDADAALLRAPEFGQRSRARSSFWPAVVSCAQTRTFVSTKERRCSALMKLVTPPVDSAIRAEVPAVLERRQAASAGHVRSRTLGRESCRLGCGRRARRFLGELCA